MEFLTPFFFTFDDDGIFNIVKQLPCYSDSATNLEDPAFLNPFDLTTVNDLNLDPYRLFCLNQEVIYWLKHNTVFKDGLLRLTRDTTLAYDHNLPEPIVEYGSKYMSPKIYITLIIRPLMDDETRDTLQRWITINADFRRKTPCLIMDSEIYIEGLNKQWIADALSLVTCDPGFQGVDTLHPDRYPKVESFILKDQWTVRLYCYLEDNFKLDSRNFNQRHNYILTSCIEQLKAMWNTCFVYDYHGILADNWPLVPIKEIKTEVSLRGVENETLVEGEARIEDIDEGFLKEEQEEQEKIAEDRKPFISVTDPNQGWYKAKPGTMIRGINPSFYLQHLQGNHRHTIKVGHNYAVIQSIDERLKQSLMNEGVSWYFMGGYLSIDVHNYSQWEIITQVVMQALKTTNKVAEVLGGDVNINGTGYTLRVIPNYEMVWKVRESMSSNAIKGKKEEMAGERQPDISPPKM